MKMVLTDRNLVKCDMVKSLLESNGVRCVLRNELSIALQGGSNLAMDADLSQWPQIWVDDAKVETAKDILARLTKS